MQKLNQPKRRTFECKNCEMAHEGETAPLRRSNIKLENKGDFKQSDSCVFNKSEILHNSSETSTDNADKNVKQKSKTHRTFTEKLFTTRESYLTTLLEVNHMQTIYHIFCVIFLLFCMNNILCEYLVKGSMSFGLGTFKIGFFKIHYVLGIWAVQHFFMFGIFYALKGWSHVRAQLAEQKTLQSMWSLACLTVYIASQLVFASVPPKICLMLDLPFVSAFVLLIESIRMLMKMHSFVRTMCARISKGKETIEGAKAVVNMPHFQKYLYFLFAPTLLYRDNYPRTRFIRWKFAASRLMEVLAVAFLFSYIYEHHVRPTFGDFGIEKINAASMTVKLFGMLMPCSIIFLCTFYMILHSWLNFTSEVMRFGDRMFYRDWWTANNYDGYYRTWNIVVHDWLYEYIYKDFYMYIFKGSKLASFLVVYLISAVFHEYLLGYALQMFFPIMFVFFAIVGVLMIFITRLVPKTVGNIMIWFSLIYGNSWMISLYSMEYFASINCPKDMCESWHDMLMPHIWYCYK